MSEHPIARHYVEVGSRLVHYRQVGSGPPVVLVHESPQDSSQFDDLARLLAPHFTVLAADTPGFGLSDPVAAPDDEPRLDRFVDAIVEWLDAIGLGQACFYGLHSGATIACRLAARHPDRVAALALNGVALFGAEERRDILANYLPRFIPDWTGAHLAWLWSRLREQSIFFPWYTGVTHAPGDLAATPIENRRGDLLRFLRCGDNYRTAYRAVFEHDTALDLVQLRVPATVILQDGDILEAQLVHWPEGCDLPRVTATKGRALARAIIDAFNGCDLPDWAPPAPSARYRRRAGVAGKGIDWRSSGPAAGQPLLILHEKGTSARAVAPLCPALADARRLIVPDLPGHGETELGAMDARGTAAALCDFLDEIGMAEVDVLTLGSAIAVGDALRQSGRVGACVAVNPVEWTLLPAADLAEIIDEDGSQLQAAWRVSRGIGLAADRFVPTRSLMEPGYAPGLAETQRRTCDLLFHLWKGGGAGSFDCDRVDTAGWHILKSGGNDPSLPANIAGWAVPILTALGEGRA